MSFYKDRNKFLHIDGTAKYVQVYQRVGDKKPLVDVNFYDGEVNTPSELLKMAEVLREASELATSWINAAE